MLSWLWMRWRWRCGHEGTRSWRVWSTTPIEPGQYLAVRYTERLAEAGAVRSVGSRADSYDNALAETVVGLYKTELIRRRGPWRTLEHLELATAEWVDWWNQRRLHGAIDNLPPAEFERRWPPHAAQRHHSRRIDRFRYHRQREPIAGAQIQAAEPPRNPGRFTTRLWAWSRDRLP